MTTDTDSTARSAMRKSFWRILPLIALAYLCAYTDRVNVGFAAAQMNADLDFSATIHGLGAGAVADRHRGDGDVVRAAGARRGNRPRGEAGRRVRGAVRLARA